MQHWVRRHGGFAAERTTMRAQPQTEGDTDSGWEMDMRGKALASTEWLQRNLDSDNLIVLDCRGNVGKEDMGGGLVVTAYEALRNDYLSGHIPGAVFVDWTKDIVDTSSPVPVQLAPLDTFAAAMEEKGVWADKTICIYDSGKMLFATRLWWALTRYGHEDVRVLDGGMQRWMLEGRDTETSEGCPLKIYGEFAARDRFPGMVANADDVRRTVQERNGGGGGLVIDARSSEQFSGDQRRARRAGRIPHAVSVPYKDLIDSKRGGYIPAREARRVLEEMGAYPSEGQKGVLYCNGGVASTAVFFALWQLGVPLEALANYDGSWGEWGNQDDEVAYPIVRD